MSIMTVTPSPLRSPFRRHGEVLLVQGDTPRPSHHSRTFEALVNDRACACGRPECRGVLRGYYLDSESPYIVASALLQDYESVIQSRFEEEEAGRPLSAII